MESIRLCCRRGWEEWGVSGYVAGKDRRREDKRVSGYVAGNDERKGGVSWVRRR